MTSKPMLWNPKKEETEKHNLFFVCVCVWERERKRESIERGIRQKLKGAWLGCLHWETREENIATCFCHQRQSRVCLHLHDSYYFILSIIIYTCVCVSIHAKCTSLFSIYNPNSFYIRSDICYHIWSW